MTRGIAALCALFAGCAVGAQGNHDPWSSTPPDPSATEDTEVALEYIDPSDLPAGPSPCRDPVLVEDIEGVDGDTVWATPVTGGGAELVRLIGFDTPEIAWDGGQSDCWAEEAQAHTRARLDGERAWLTFDGDCIDPYDRTLAYLHTGLGDDDFFNVHMVREGYGDVLIIPPNDAFRDELYAAEEEAQDADLGVWTCP